MAESAKLSEEDLNQILFDNISAKLDEFDGQAGGAVGATALDSVVCVLAALAVGMGEPEHPLIQVGLQSIGELVGSLLPQEDAEQLAANADELRQTVFRFKETMAAAGYEMPSVLIVAAHRVQ